MFKVSKISFLFKDRVYL